MDAPTNIGFSRHANVFSGSLSLEDVRHRAPAVFAESAHERTSPNYTFVPTARVLTGLNQSYVDGNRRSVPSFAKARTAGSRRLTSNRL